MHRRAATTCANDTYMHICMPDSQCAAGLSARRPPTTGTPPRHAGPKGARGCAQHSSGTKGAGGSD